MRHLRFALPIVVSLLVWSGSAAADPPAVSRAPATIPDATAGSNTPKTVLHRATAATDRGIKRAAAATERGTHKAVEATKRGLNKAGDAIEKAAKKTKDVVTGKGRESRDAK
jgi:hypothetical protein